MVHTIVNQTRLGRSYHKPLELDVKQPIVELLKLFRVAEAEIKESKLNSTSISDNNGARIYF